MNYYVNEVLSPLGDDAADLIERLHAQVVWMHAVNTQLKDDLTTINSQHKPLEQIVLELKTEAENRHE
jgi:hypothetical protein